MSPRWWLLEIPRIIKPIRESYKDFGPLGLSNFGYDCIQKNIAVHYFFML